MPPNRGKLTYIAARHQFCRLRQFVNEVDVEVATVADSLGPTTVVVGRQSTVQPDLRQFAVVVEPRQSLMR